MPTERIIMKGKTKAAAIDSRVAAVLVKQGRAVYADKKFPTFAETQDVVNKVNKPVDTNTVVEKGGNSKETENKTKDSEKEKAKEVDKKASKSDSKKDSDKKSENTTSPWATVDKKADTVPLKKPAAKK